jgi:hypothetical protein
VQVQVHVQVQVLTDPTHLTHLHRMASALSGKHIWAHSQGGWSHGPPLTLGIVRRVDGAEKHLDEPHLGGEVDALWRWIGSAVFVPNDSCGTGGRDR